MQATLTEIRNRHYDRVKKRMNGAPMGNQNAAGPHNMGGGGSGSGSGGSSSKGGAKLSDKEKQVVDELSKMITGSKSDKAKAFGVNLVSDWHMKGLINEAQAKAIMENVTGEHSGSTSGSETGESKEGQSGTGESKHSWSSNENWKPSSTKSVETLLGKDAKDVTMKDTRQAIKEYKEEFAKAVEKASRDTHSAGAYEIRLDFDRYHKEIAKKMSDIEKNGNKNTMEGRVAIKDAGRFLWDGAGCDRNKIAW